MATNGDPDLDITILPESEKPKNSADGADMLPHFQFLDGRGSLQNSSERPIEGFMALKITYEHLLKKQREQARLLQQKDQQLAFLKEEREKGKLDKLKQNKIKLRSGIVRFATFLLNKVPSNSPLAEVLKQIIDNLESLECDSEESVRHVCSLIEELYNMDDCKFEYIQEAGQRQKDASCSSKDASLQRIVRNFQQAEDSDYESQKKTTQQEQEPHETGQLEREKSQDEDMYGAEEGETTDDSELVPYNWIRLQFKLMKLQQMPSEYRSLAQQLSSISLQQQQQQQRRAWNSNIQLLPRSVGTETQPVSSASGSPTSQMSSFVGIPSIKRPPSDLHGVYHLDIGENSAGQAGMEDSTNTIKYDKNVEDIFISRQVPSSRKPSAMVYTTRPNSSEVPTMQANASSPIWQQPTSSPRFYTKDSKMGHDARGLNDALYNQARDPPSHSGANNYPVVSSVYHRPLRHGYAGHHQTHNSQRFDYSPTAIGSGFTEAKSTTLTAQSPRRDPSPVKMGVSDLNHSELTMEYPQSPYLPGSESTHDQLVTAHTVMRNMSVNGMQCPVCSKKFPEGTPEEMVSRHVNSHFEDEEFEVLHASS